MANRKMIRNLKRKKTRGSEDQKVSVEKMRRLDSEKFGNLNELRR